MTPSVNPDAGSSEGAIFNPGEGWVDLPSLITVLLEEFTELGGRLLTDVGRASVVVEDGRVTGVKLAEEILSGEESPLRARFRPERFHE